MREDKKILVVRKYIKNSIVFFLIILSFLFNCCNLGNKKHSKNNHIATFKKGDNLYNEKFQIYFGVVYAGDSYIEYITDSINFRKYIGTYNDDEWMIYKINNQFIDVYKRNIKVVTRVIIGLPNENKNDVFSTIDYINEQKTWGIKLHLLYILKNTGLFEYYKSNPFEIMEKEEYISMVTEIISRLDKEIVIHRLTGDAPWKDLYEPKWSTDKRGILNGINKLLKEKKIYQGKERRE